MISPGHCMRIRGFSGAERWDQVRGKRGRGAVWSVGVLFIWTRLPGLHYRSCVEYLDTMGLISSHAHRANEVCWPKTPSEIIRDFGLTHCPCNRGQSNEDWNRDEPSPSLAVWLRHDSPKNPLPDPLVWTCLIEVFDMFLDYRMKLAVVDNEQVIDAFSPHALQESFADCVCRRRTDKGDAFVGGLAPKRSAIVGS